MVTSIKVLPYNHIYRFKLAQIYVYCCKMKENRCICYSSIPRWTCANMHAHNVHTAEIYLNTLLSTKQSCVACITNSSHVTEPSTMHK